MIPEDRKTSEQKEGWLRTRRVVMVALGAGLLAAWLINTPPGLLGKTDAVAYAVCHRISSHSFHFAERPFALCARCSGQYLGFLWGFIIQTVLGKKRSGFPSRWQTALLIGLIVFYLIDGLNSFIQIYPDLAVWSIYQPDNHLRLFSGLGMGLALSGFYYPLLGQTLWKEFSSDAPLQGLLDWMLFIGGAVVLGGLVIWENPLVSYFLILLSTGGLLVLLTMLYTVIWILIFRQENSFSHWGDIKWWMVAGSLTALAQIALLDAVRFMITGSWSGFLDY